MWTENGAGGRGQIIWPALRLWFKRVVVGGATNVDASDGPNPRAKAAPPPNSAVRHASRSKALSVMRPICCAFQCTAHSQ